MSSNKINRRERLPDFVCTRGVIRKAKRNPGHAAKCQDDFCRRSRREDLAMVQATKQNNPLWVVIGWTRMGLVGSTNWLENFTFHFQYSPIQKSTNEDKHYSNHVVFISTHTDIGPHIKASSTMQTKMKSQLLLQLF